MSLMDSGNGHKKAFDMLKLALGVVLLGGSSAFTAGKLAAKSTDERVTVQSERITAVVQDVNELKKTAAQASYDAARAAINTEVILRHMGAEVPRPPPKPKVLQATQRDAGE